MAWDYDVLIVGSGPSGSSVALNLAQQAPELAGRTAILERGQHPRHKLCAGALVPDVDRCLLELGLPLDGVPTLSVKWVNALYQGRGFKLQLGRDMAFRICQRNQFDSWLTQMAQARGVQVHEQTRVTAVHAIEGGAEVVTDRGTYRARVVVGADGASSLVRRTLTNQQPGDTSNVARLIEIITPEPSAPAADAQPQVRLLANEAAIELGFTARGIQGYVWDFPTQIEARPRRNRGVYDSRIVPTMERMPLRSALESELAKQGQRLADFKLEAAPLRWFEPDGVLAGPHRILTGDAAGVDAMFGEGISIALGYGPLVAAALRDAFARDDFSFTSYPARVRKSAMGRALRRRSRVAKLAFSLARPELLQRAMWWHGGPVLSWVIKNHLFNWSAAAGAA